MTIQITDKDIKAAISNTKPIFLYRDEANHINFHIAFCWTPNVEPKMTYGFQVGNYSWCAPDNYSLHTALYEFHKKLKEHDERYIQ